MRYIYRLSALSAMVNTFVKETLPPNRFELSILASASIDFILNSWAICPYSEINTDLFADPSIFSHSAKLDQYLLEVRLIMPDIVYTNEQLRLIFSEICSLMYLDLKEPLRQLFNHYPVRVFHYRVEYCDYDTLRVIYR